MNRTRTMAAAVAAAAAAAVTACSCAPHPSPSAVAGWAEDPGCAQVRAAVAAGEAVDYLGGQDAWVLHSRQVLVSSPQEDACWQAAPVAEVAR